MTKEPHPLDVVGIFIEDAGKYGLVAEVNNCKGQCSISQDDVDAVLVGFINKIGVRRWVDYGLYTKDLHDSN